MTRKVEHKYISTHMNHWNHQAIYIQHKQLTWDYCHLQAT
ncbi:hypothetical protein HHI36_024025 [Cryptolaemus montrouzieri]|uniref:Uncharacterized protein n=1 Tax=Cryptolaemus montrouzieri TaxID=559131 RepID=A0ABD2N7N6_9CUCU